MNICYPPAITKHTLACLPGGEKQVHPSHYCCRRWWSRIQQPIRDTAGADGLWPQSARSQWEIARSRYTPHFDVCVLVCTASECDRAAFIIPRVGAIQVHCTNCFKMSCRQIMRAYIPPSRTAFSFILKRLTSEYMQHFHRALDARVFAFHQKQDTSELIIIQIHFVLYD